MVAIEYTAFRVKDSFPCTYTDAEAPESERDLLRGRTRHFVTRRCALKGAAYESFQCSKGNQKVSKTL